MTAPPNPCRVLWAHFQLVYMRSFLHSEHVTFTNKWILLQFLIKNMNFFNKLNYDFANENSLYQFLLQLIKNSNFCNKMKFNFANENSLSIFWIFGLDCSGDWNLHAEQYQIRRFTLNIDDLCLCTNDFVHVISRRNLLVEEKKLNTQTRWFSNGLKSWWRFWFCYKKSSCVLQTIVSTFRTTWKSHNVKHNWKQSSSFTLSQVCIWDKFW